ncbi:hypothetical protein R1sor_021456 [Riccia sorocarpa]|uniref:Uncharacterized protein n=1 Tax=Riccia sorocarpa TaxID=122646 RepID=A0ABD3GK97_9MARC
MGGSGSGSGLALALDLLRTSATSTKSLHSFSSFSSLSAALAASVGVNFLPSYPVYRPQFGSWDWNGDYALCDQGVNAEEPWQDSRWVPQYEPKDEAFGKTYNVELKPLFSAFRPRALAATTVRCSLVNFLPLLEAYVQPDDDDMEEDVDRPANIPVDPVVPMKRSVIHILREVSVITIRRILERAAVHYASPRMAWKLLKDIPKSASRKAGRDVTRFQLFVGVCKTTFRAHALGVMANWVVQLIMDVYRYLRVSTPAKKGEGRKQVAQDSKDFNKLVRKTAGNTLKVGASLALGSVGAGLGTVLIKPSIGTWIGLAAGDLAGPYLVSLWLDGWIFYGTFIPPAPMASEGHKSGATIAEAEPGGGSSSKSSPRHRISESTHNTGSEALNTTPDTQIEEPFIPQDPLQQKELLEALNANYEMIRKIIMKQSQAGSPRISPRPGTSTSANQFYPADKLDPNSPGLQDRSPSELRQGKGVLMAAATQQHGEDEGEINKDPHRWSSTFTNPSYTQEKNADRDSPIKLQQRPPGTPSSNTPVDGSESNPSENHLEQEKNDTTRHSSKDFHTTASVIQQLLTPRTGIHSTASIQQQLEIQGPRRKENTRGESNEAPQNSVPSSSSEGRRPPNQRSYAQATNPATTPGLGEDAAQNQPPVWSP